MGEGCSGSYNSLHPYLHIPKFLFWFNRKGHTAYFSFFCFYQCFLSYISLPLIERAIAKVLPLLEYPPRRSLEIAEALVLVAPLRLDAVGHDAPRHHALPLVDEAGLGRLPVVARVRPQALGEGGSARPQLEEGNGLC